MKYLIRSTCILATSLLLTGCLPDEPQDYLWWSPNGETAAIRTPDGLRLAGTNGQLSAVVLPAEIQSAAWMPDSSSLLVSRSFTVTNWTAIESLVPSQETAVARQLAAALPDMLKGGLTVTGGKAKDLDEKFLKPLGMADNPVLDAAWFCALDLYRQQIQAVIAGFTNAPANEAELFSAATNGYEVHEIAILPVRDGLVAGESQALLRSLYPLANPMVSPHYPVVAFLAGKGRLQVMPLAGTNSLDAADKDVVSATWSADGRSLVYIVATEKQLVSEILSRTVLDAAGQLLTNAAPEDTLALAAVVPDTSPRLAALPDGRILFASMPLALPVRPTTVNLSARFFLVDPANTNSVPTPIEIKEGSLPDDLSAFSVSPDGRFVAVVESGTDAVALLELATGKVQIIAPAHKGAKSKLIPAWRNSRQLAYAGMPSPAATRPELILWQPDASPHVLSAGWPDDVVKPWLELPQKDAEQNQK